MEVEEETKPSKLSKLATTSQETPTHPSYPDWSGSVQAYYGGGTAPAFFTSTVASSTVHPYVWAGQHPIISPYRNPVSYPAMYPLGAVYAHPNIAIATKVSHGKSESEGKIHEAKDMALAKKPKGSLSFGCSKAGEIGKAASGSGNESASQSVESEIDGSLDASDENSNHGHRTSKKGSFNQMLTDGASQQNNTVFGGSIRSSVPGKPVVSMPTTNLSIGLWNRNPAAPLKLRPESAIKPTDQWIQDERELKRQKRKQSNRESARRSRLRKQAECEDLQRNVESLFNDNRSLSQELNKLTEECNKLTSENNFIKEELNRLYGPEAISNLEDENTAGDR